MIILNQEYIKVGIHIFAKLDNTFQWVYLNGKSVQLISSLKVVEILSRLWESNKQDKYALKRYEQGEFGFGGLPYSLAKSMKRRQAELTQLIINL